MSPSDDTAVDLLTEMVRTRSLCGKEDAVAEVMGRSMREFGFRAVRRDEVGNVVGEIGPEDAERLVILLGHMDTVPGEIPVDIRDGALYGRGSVDAKGPLATAIIAAARAGERTHARLTVIGAVQEEGPSVGAHHLTGMQAPDMLIIGEPSSWESIVLGYKGSQSFTMKVTLPVTHSASPEPTAAEWIYALWRRIVAWCEAHEPPSGKESQSFYRLTPTLIRTGWNEDGLHETAFAQVGLRLPPGITPEWVRTKLEQISPEAHFSYSPGTSAVRSERTTALVSRFTRAIRDEGGQPRYKLKTGTSDMNVVLPVWGCQAVAYGPGDSRLDHTPEEHVPLEDYLRAVRVLTRVLEEA